MGPQLEPEPAPEPVPCTGVGVGVSVGAGFGVQGTGRGAGSGTRVGAGDPGTGVIGGTNVGIGAGARDCEGAALAPLSCDQVVPSQAQSSSDTGTAGGCDAGFDDLKLGVGSPPKSSSLPDTPS